MPLLRNEKFEPHKINYLDPSQEVFYLHLTKEVFLNYDEFFERSILCNSMVWSCSVTNRAGLTYYEALKSEQSAYKELEVLPRNFHAPLLLLAGLSNTSRIADLTSNIFSFCRQRYFIGEEVNVSCDLLRSSGVIRAIICPAVLAYQKLDKFAPVPLPPPEELRYVIKVDGRMGEIVVNCYALQRDRDIFNKMKCQSFLRTCCKLTLRRFIVRKEFFERYSLQKLSFEDFWGPGPLPDFAVSPEVVEERKNRLESINLFLCCKNGVKEAQAFERNGVDRTYLSSDKKKKSKKTMVNGNDKVCEHSNSASGPNLNSVAKVKKSELEEKLEEARKQQEREEKRLKAEWMKKWNRIRDDLELEDHREMPEPTGLSIDLTRDSNFQGDSLFCSLLCVLEFLNGFGDLLKLNEFLPHGTVLTLQYLVEAVHEHSIFGNLYLIFSCLLSNIFTCLDQTYEYEIDLSEQTDILMEISTWELLSNESQNILLKASETVFHCLSHLGIPLTRIPINPYTLSEVLRLFINSAGFKSLSEISRLKAQKSSLTSVHDSPAVEFKLTNQRIINRLEYQSIFNLTVEEKLKILNCLCNELSVLKQELKEGILDSAESIHDAKVELKKLQKAEAKRKREIALAKCWRHDKPFAEPKNQNDAFAESRGFLVLQNLSKLDVQEVQSRKQMMLELVLKHQPQDMDDDLDVFDCFTEDQLFEMEALFHSDCEDEVLTSDVKADFFEKRAMIRAELEMLMTAKESRMVNEILKQQSLWGAAPLGHDRVHRRYWKFQTVPGIFVEEDIEFRKWAQANASRGHYTPPCFEEVPNWDMEEMVEHGSNGAPMHPKWPPLDLVPSGTERKSVWSFYSKESDIDDLIMSLNNRGLRETSLKESLSLVKKTISKELELPDSANSLEILTEYDPSVWSSENSSVDLVEEFCKSCKIMFQRLCVGNLMSSFLSLHNKQRIFAQINAGFAHDGIVTEDISIQSFGEMLCQIASSIRKDCLNAPLQSNQNNERYIAQEQDPQVDLNAFANDGSSMPSISYKVEKLPFMERWCNGLKSSAGVGQLFLYLHLLNSSVRWSKGNVNKFCSACLLDATDLAIANPTNVLQFCKFCNKSYHKTLFCFGSRHLTTCSNCSRLKKKPRKPVNQMESNGHHETRSSSNNSNYATTNNKHGTRSITGSISKIRRLQEAPEENEVTEKSSEPLDKFAVLPVLDDGVFCELCNLGGFVLCCDKCPKMFHLRCADPPLNDVPDNDWFCQLCAGKVTTTEFELLKRSKMREKTLMMKQH